MCQFRRRQRFKKAPKSGCDKSGCKSCRSSCGKSCNVSCNHCNKCTKPTLSWATPAPIVEGTPLSATQLNAVATGGGRRIPGRYVYDPPAGTVLGSGIQQLTVVFRPNDAKRWCRATRNNNIAVGGTYPGTAAPALRATAVGYGWLPIEAWLVEFTYTVLGGTLPFYPEPGVPFETPEPWEISVGWTAPPSGGTVQVEDYWSRWPPAVYYSETLGPMGSGGTGDGIMPNMFMTYYYYGYLKFTFSNGPEYFIWHGIPYP